MCDERKPEDTFKILLATDCHLGYEQSTKRFHKDDDSFTTFEEILQYAKKEQVDFILLGGDLFHETRPDHRTIMKCIDLLRKYCLGPRKSDVQFLSDPTTVLSHCLHKKVNFEDENLNISIPVFSIHGNHDDPSFGTTGSLDLLSTTGLVNYFGKWTDLSQIDIFPLVFRKGETTISIFGLSYINDQRLSRLMRDEKVRFLCPKETDPNKMFNIFVLHQNRTKHAYMGYIQEAILPDFLDFVLWGHEHECRIEETDSLFTKFDVCQPGSSVATSLCYGESVPKHIGVLSICGKEYLVESRKLKTVRPFVFDNLVLNEEDLISSRKSKSAMASELVTQHIEEVMMTKAAELLTGHPQQPKLPLMRLRVFYKNEDEIFDTLPLYYKFLNEVANPNQIVLFRKQSMKNADESGGKGRGRGRGEAGDGAEAAVKSEDDYEPLFGLDAGETDEAIWSRNVEDEISKLFQTPQYKGKLSVLSVGGLNEALNRYITSMDNDAFADVVKYQTGKVLDHLRKKDIDSPEEIKKEILNYRHTRENMAEAENVEIAKMLNDEERRTKAGTSRGKKDDSLVNDSDLEMHHSGDEEADSGEKSSKRGARGGRGSRGTRGTRGSRNARAPGGRGSRGGRGRAQAADVDAFSRPSSSQRPLPIKVTPSQSTIFASFSSQNQKRVQTTFLPDSDSD